MTRLMIRLLLLTSLCVMPCAAGCGGSDDTAPGGNSTAAAQSGETDSQSNTASPTVKKRREFAPIKLANSSNTGGNGDKPAADLTPEQKTQRAFAAIKQLQILVDEWSGVTSKSKKFRERTWVWDFSSDKSQPALKTTSAESDYLREGRLSYDVDKQKYQLAGITGDGVDVLFEGDFSEPIRDEAGDDEKLQRTYKLQLTQVSPADSKLIWEVVFNQQNNHRLLLEWSKKRQNGAVSFRDVVTNQRKGTSFALDDSDYGERTCVVSQGLGTMPVTYKERTFYVCCNGCKAAFEDEPERWIAKYEKMKAEKKK